MSTAVKVMAVAALAVLAVSALSRLAATRSRNGGLTLTRYTDPFRYQGPALTVAPLSTSPGTITFRYDWVEAYRTVS